MKKADDQVELDRLISCAPRILIFHLRSHRSLSNKRIRKLYYILSNNIEDMTNQQSTRPHYHCEKCNKDFPSMLDLEEHNKIDHAEAATSSVA